MLAVRYYAVCGDVSWIKGKYGCREKIIMTVQGSISKMAELFGVTRNQVNIIERCATSVQITATELSGVGTYTYLLVGDGVYSDIMQMVVIK